MTVELGVLGPTATVNKVAATCVVIVISHPLHVLSHWPGTFLHNPCAKIV